MRVLVCGGRDFGDWVSVYAALDRLHSVSPITCIIHGSAKGADELAARWAFERHVAEMAFCADWINHGRAAGPIRNQLMIDQGKPGWVIAFPGGKGTSDMISRAKKSGIRVQKEPLQ